MLRIMRGMPMAPTDHPLKRIVELTPHAPATWLLGQPVAAVTSQRGELTASPAPLDTDMILLVTFKDDKRVILHIELQGSGSRIPIPVRALAYMVRIFVQERDIPIITVVIYLGGAGATDDGYYEIKDHAGTVRIAWQYNVVRLWQITSEELLAMDHPTLTVLIGQTRITQPERDLRQAMERINTHTTGELRERLMLELLLLCPNEEISTMAHQIFKQDYGLPEPPVIEIWRREGREEGREQGREEGQETLILRQLSRRFGTLPDAIVAHIQRLDSPRLLDLADALLDFSQYSDLTDWLAQHSEPTA